MPGFMDTVKGMVGSAKEKTGPTTEKAKEAAGTAKKKADEMVEKAGDKVPPKVKGTYDKVSKKVDGVLPTKDPVGDESAGSVEPTESAGSDDGSSA